MKLFKSIFFFYAFIFIIGISCLEVFEIPDHTIKFGENVTLRCSFQSDEPTRAMWTQLGSTRSFPPSNSTQHLELLLKRNQYSRTYTCVVETARETRNLSANVFVLAKPEIRDYDLGVDVKSIGDRAEIKCEIIFGNPEPKWEWKFNDGPLPVNVKVENSKPFFSNYEISTLVIPEIRAENFGNYTCLSENEYGIDNRTVKLLTLEKPRTPNLKCTIGFKRLRCIDDSTKDYWHTPDRRPSGYMVYASLEKDLNKTCCEGSNSMKSCGITPTYIEYINSPRDYYNLKIFGVATNTNYILQAVAKNKMGESNISTCVSVSTYGLDAIRTPFSKSYEGLCRLSGIGHCNIDHT